MEFETLRRPSNSTLTINYDSHNDFGVSDHPAEHGGETISDTAPFGSVAVRQIPSIGVPHNTISKTDGTSDIRSTTSSRNSRLNHELSSETTENHYSAIEGFHALSGSTVGASSGEDTDVPREAV